MKKSVTKNQKGFAHWVIIIILVVVAAIGIAAYKITAGKSGQQTSEQEAATATDFIQSDFIDLSKIYSISKFRSGEGHDFSGGGETCRSMKHYFYPQIDPNVKLEKAVDGRSIPPQPDGIHDIDIFSPVDGVITEIASERFPVGEQIYIQPSNAKKFTIRLFHIYKSDGIEKGAKLTSGQKIGVISGYSATDISVQSGSDTYISYFDVMPDSLFESYKARGATTRDDFIFSKESRDANPIPCNQDKQGDQSFNYPNDYDHDADSFRLSGYVEPDYTKPQQNQN